MPYPHWEPAPVAPRFHKFDPETRYTPQNRGGMGWPGYFPTTPCRNCGCEYFRWVGDWDLGFACANCRHVWKP